MNRENIQFEQKNVRLKLTHYLSFTVRICSSIIELIASLIVVVISILPIVIARIVSKRTSPMRILLAGNETAANLRQIGLCLATSRKYIVTVLQFSTHRFYSHGPFVGLTDNFTFDESFLDKLRSNEKARKYFGRRIKRQAKKIFYFFKVIYSFDVVFFNWSKSFLPFNLDYPLLRIAGKKIIVRHCGDDVRYRPLQDGIHSIFGINQWANATRDNLEACRKFFHQIWAETFVVVLSSRDHATFQSRAIGIRPYVQLTLPQTTGFDTKIPLILHAPSDPKIKGTHIFKEAVKILTDEGLAFNFAVLTGVNHEEVLRALSKATIVVDQPGAVPARFAVEAMVSGCVVIGGNVEAIHGLTKLPIIQFPENAQELAFILKKYVNSNEEARKFGEEAKRYAMENFSCSSFCVFFESLLVGNYLTFDTLGIHDKLLMEAAKNRVEKILVHLLGYIRQQHLKKLKKLSNNLK